MGRVEDNIAALQVYLDTALTADEIYRATQKAAQAAQLRAGNGKMREIRRAPSPAGYDEMVTYAVLNGLAAIESARIAVTWRDEGNGRSKVHVVVANYNVSQEKILFAVPAGPKIVPAMRCMRRFVDALRVELASPSTAPRHATTQHRPPAVSEPKTGSSEHATRGGNPSMSQARQRLIDEGAISAGEAGSAAPTRRSTDLRCENCNAEIDGGDRFCRSCGTELAEPEEPDVVSGTGNEPGGFGYAAGVLEQVKDLDAERVQRIVDRARELAPRSESLDAANEIATREEAMACAYCFRLIRDILTENRLPGRRLEGTSVSDEVVAAEAGRNAALAYLLGDRLDEPDRRSLLELWIAAVGEPPATGDLVELALQDKNSQRADGSTRNPTSGERMAYWKGK